MKQFHSNEKSERGALSDFLTFILLPNMEKLEGGPSGDIKNFLF